MKIFYLVYCGLFSCHFSTAQKISEKEATDLLKKTITYLKNDDTTSFANMWYYDNTGRPSDNSVFTRTDAIQNFNELKVFLDTALIKNMVFDYVDVFDFKSWSEYKVKYKIKAWFKYDDKIHYYKGYGVLVSFVENRWVFRYGVELSFAYREK